MTNLSFPYDGHQLLLSSDRVTLYSKKDAILILGKSTVSISTQGSLNIDAKKEVIVNSPKINLGLKAKEKILLGETTLKTLQDVFNSLKNLSEALSNLNETNFSSIVPQIRNRSEILKDVLNEKILSIEENLSKTTYSE